MQGSSEDNRIKVLIPDGESHLLIYVVNCLAQAKDVDIYVISKTKQNPMRYSRHIKEFSFYINTYSDIDWIEAINKEVSRYNIDVIMPIFETSIKKLIVNKDEVEKQEALGLLPSLEDYCIAFNKNQLAKHLEFNGLPFSKSEVISSVEQLEKINNLNFPIIIKPVEGFGGGQGIYKFNAIKDLKSHFDKTGFKYENLIQEYVEGYDIDCSVLCKDGEILAHTIQKGNMMGKHQFSPQFGLEFVYDDNLYKVVEKLMKSLNWSGVAHIDMRYDRFTDQFKAIEINTRFWVSLEASLISGINFPYLYVLASMGKSFQKPHYRFINYVNFKGIIKKLSKNILSSKNLELNTSLKFAINDPLPMAYKFVWRTKNIIKSRFSKMM